MAAVPTIGRATGVEPRPAPEADATRTLYERYARQIFSYCLHQLSSREEAEDAVQTTFMNAFRGLKRGVVPEAEQAWLFKIAENVCLSRRRSSWRRGRVEAPNDFEILQEVVPSRSQTSNVELIGLEDALAAMPENQRRAILLREWQGLSYREIADELELSQAAVETLIFRARRTLANGLEQAQAPKKKRRLRAGEGVNLGSLLAGLKSLISSGVAVKAVAIAAVATVAAPQAAHVAATVERQVAPPKHHAVHAVAVPQKTAASFSASSTLVAAATGTTVEKARARVHPLAAAFDRAAHGSAARTAEESSPTLTAPIAPTAPTEQPVAPAAPAADPPKKADPVAAPPATPSGNENRGNDNKGDNGNGNAKKDDPPAAATPATPAAPANGNNDAKGNNGKGDDKKADPAPSPPAATPSSAATPGNNGNGNGNTDAKDKDTGNANGNNGNGNGNAKKDDPAPVPPATPAAPTAVAAPATGNGNGNANANAGTDKGNGNGNEKKSDPVATPPVVAPLAPPTSPVAAPPVPPTNPPQHGDGNGGNGKGNGKGK